MTAAHQLASELQAAIAGVNQELARISEERWSSTITSAEGWSVGHTAHHIGEGYIQSRTWIEEAGRTGQPVVLDPAVDIARINVTNARCLDDMARNRVRRRLCSCATRASSSVVVTEPALLPSS